MTATLGSLTVPLFTRITGEEIHLGDIRVPLSLIEDHRLTEAQPRLTINVEPGQIDFAEVTDRVNRLIVT